MDNAPIFTTNNAPEGTSFKTPRKSPNPKVFGIGAIVVTVLATVGIILLLPKETPVRAGEFNDNASSTREVEEVRTFVSLEEFELSDPLLSPYNADEAEDKIIKFFTYAFPEISTLTAKDLKTEDNSSSEASSEENPSSGKTLTYTLSSNTGKTFFAEISFASNLSSYFLVIKSMNGSELYSYSGGEVTKDLFDHSSESLLDLIFAELPLSGETNGEQFDITYEGDEKDRLTLSATSDEETLKNCDAVKSAAVSLVSNLNLGFSGEISAENFICE